MTLFDRPITPEAYAMIRFGLGYPTLNAPVTAAAMLSRLQGPDDVAARYPGLPFKETVALGRALRGARKAERAGTGDRGGVKAARRALQDAFAENLVADLSRCAETDDPFRERLVRFWADHFTARHRSVELLSGQPGYEAEAIRPHVAGRFGEMLKAAVTHPFMLVYLDQNASVGPASEAGMRSGRGLNENLAREVLELHTLGAGGPYTQADVREFAELLTGLYYNAKGEAVFLPNRAEPGDETVLGRSYGGARRGGLGAIHAALDDLAVHPATADHVAAKLARHFVSDDPDPGMVGQMAEAFRGSGGWLPDVYAAMLDHPAAWSGFGAKAKRPHDLVASSMRALGITADELARLKPRRVARFLLPALQAMGQPWRAPPGPDGWPETAEAWIHPHGLAARIRFAQELAANLPVRMPDPRAFLDHALGPVAGARLVWAVGAAESRAEGLALVLASAEFNRR